MLQTFVIPHNRLIHSNLVEVKDCLIRQTIYKTNVPVNIESIIPFMSEQSEPQKFASFGGLIFNS
jgi:hypothetical protein